MILSLFFYYTGLNVTSCCSRLISFLRVSYILSCGGADVRMGQAQLAFLLHRMYGNFLFYIGRFLQWKPICFSSVSCFHVFPCVHFQCTLPAPARACVLRDLTNEHKVTKFEQEAEHDDEVGCQDQMPRILFPLPTPARACVLRDLTSSSCARALVCCVI